MENLNGRKRVVLTYYLPTTYTVYSIIYLSFGSNLVLTATKKIILKNKWSNLLQASSPYSGGRRAAGYIFGRVTRTPESAGGELCIAAAA